MSQSIGESVTENLRETGCQLARANMRQVRIRALLPFIRLIVRENDAAAAFSISGQMNEAVSNALMDPLSTDLKTSLGAAKPMGQTNILLIDDNAVQAATRQAILRRAGYFVIAALNPQRVLEQFREKAFPEEIGLVITDHLMPGMNGAAFTRELRTLAPAMPVMVISGLEEAEEEYAGLDVTFRMKPLPPDNLLASVQRLMQDSPSS